MIQEKTIPFLVNESMFLKQRLLSLYENCCYLFVNFFLFVFLFYTGVAWLSSARGAKLSSTLGTGVQPILVVVS